MLRGAVLSVVGLLRPLADFRPDDLCSAYILL